MAYILTETGARRYLPPQRPDAFVHKPSNKGKDAVKREFCIPTLHRERWDYIWSAIKSQEWYEEDVGLVMVCTDGYAYCQYPSLTTGFARAFVGAVQ